MDYLRPLSYNTPFFFDTSASHDIQVNIPRTLSILLDLDTVPMT